ncbi:hypothetical protein GCM10009555_028090 [Acrocarpospora macrocephala]|uniref:Uncharacterized protein n=1 Tax=Acrocarpospora macrocephala TaxID=150177 RepID=A0A5M3XDF1_9ACTN|nr:hypothetical protein Amac_105510 [Acrocarpospora macrocephala]
MPSGLALNEGLGEGVGSAAADPVGTIAATRLSTAAAPVRRKCLDERGFLDTKPPCGLRDSSSHSKRRRATPHPFQGARKGPQPSPVVDDGLTPDHRLARPDTEFN